MRASWKMGFMVFPAVLMSLGSADAGSQTKWDDVVGIAQAGNQVGSGTGRVTGAGQPWTTQNGKAQVDLRTGHLKFSVKGLVLAGGNSIGTPGTVDAVKGTLVCDTNGSASGDTSSELVDTDLVALSSEGDADFSGNVALLPVCQTEADIAFVIRTASGAWIANGSVRTP